MKYITSIIVCLLSLQNLVFSQDESDEWMWVQYPWAYSATETSWVYMLPVEGRLWLWHMNDNHWELKFQIPEVSTPKIDMFTCRSSFSSIEDLEDWTEETTPTGFLLEHLEYNNNEFIIIRRVFAWAIYRSDISVFSKSSDTYIRRNHMNASVGLYQYSMNDGILHISITEGDTTESEPLLTINLDQLSKVDAKGNP